MATFTIPNSQKQIRQVNRSETIGELGETFGIDLNRKFGKIYPSKKLIKVLDEVTHLGNSSPVAFAIFDNRYYLLTDDDPYYCSLTNDPTVATNWTEDTNVTSAIESDSDMVVFGGLLLISNGGSSIYSLTDTGTFANNWQSGKISGLTNAGQMHVTRGGQETLIVCNGNNVKYYNTTGGSYTISLQSDLSATCVSSGVSAVWVGTESTSDGDAYVYEFYIGDIITVTDSSGAVISSAPAARNAYKIEGTKVMSMEVIDNIPYIITEKGNLQAFNGSGFSTVTSFPFANTTEVISTAAVHPKGMKSHNDSLYINISTERRSDTQQDYVGGCPSGIWEYNRTTGQLHHRFAFAEDNTEYGARETENASSGPIMIIDNEHALILAGAASGKSTATTGMYADIGTPYGYFKTIEIESDSVQDVYEKIYAKAKTLAANESIQIKYRTEKHDPVTVDGHMASARQINTTDAVGSIDENWIAIDIHSGVIAQVVSVTGGTTKQIIVSSDFNTTGDSCRVEFQNWRDVTDLYETADGEFKQWGGLSTNPWIQFLVILDGDIELRQFMVKSNVKNEV
jgi:hypothetical protein